MAYQALYRKWRPMRFDDVVGQEHVTTTIKNEIAHGAVAHAYLFTGTRGTGKTSTAKIFSRAVNCLHPENGNPCNQCEICRGILDESILDIVEIDAASNTGVENIREIIDQGRYRATVSKNRVYIIDEVHMLSQGAFNALLKTLEEPPAGVIFILATTEIHKVPATILSRCQRFDFKTITAADIAGRIRYILQQEGIAADDEAIDYVAYLGDGSMRDALSILDQCLAFRQDGLTYADVVRVVGALDDGYLFQMAKQIAAGDTAGVLAAFGQCISDGRNTDYFVESLLSVFRDVLMVQLAGVQPGMSAKRASGAAELAGIFTKEETLHCITVFSELLTELRFSSSPRVLIEVALIKLSQPRLDDSSGGVLARLSRLEDAAASGKLAVAPQMHAEPAAEEPEDLPWPTDEDAPLQTESGNSEQAPEESAGQPSPEEAAASAIAAANWKDVVDALMRNGHLTLYMDLFQTTVVLQDEVLYIRFADRDKRDRIAKKEALALVQEQVHAVYGRALSVQCVMETEAGIPPGKTGDSAETGDIFGQLAQIKAQFPENVKLDEN